VARPELRVPEQTFFLPFSTEAVPVGISPSDALTVIVNTAVCSAPYPALATEAETEVVVGTSGAFAAYAGGDHKV
jgi:hypothetical protein